MPAVCSRAHADGEMQGGNETEGGEQDAGSGHGPGAATTPAQRGSAGGGLGAKKKMGQGQGRAGGARGAWSGRRGRERERERDAASRRAAEYGLGGRLPVSSAVATRNARAWRAVLAVCWLVCGASANDVYTVGYNDYGQLGLGDYLERSTQTLMRKMPLELTEDVAAGLYHNVAVGVKDGIRGTVYTWGRNTKGQLGHGSVISSKEPKQVFWQACEEPNSHVCNPSYCKVLFFAVVLTAGCARPPAAGYCPPARSQIVLLTHVCVCARAHTHTRKHARTDLHFSVCARAHARAHTHTHTHTPHTAHTESGRRISEGAKLLLERVRP